MIKLRGFGGPTEFWDHNLESFTLMAGLAAVTSRIRLYASVAVLTIPPAIVARMAVTIDSISHGRFGVNMVSGWQKAEYEQMGLWPGDEHFPRRYKYTGEYVRIMRELWEAGQSDTGMMFCATHGDYNFMMGTGLNTPSAFAPANQRLMAAAEKTGRDVGAYVLFMVIADETDEAAMAKWQLYKSGVDTEALAWMADQGAADKTAGQTSTARHINLPDSAVNFNMGTLVGSYASVARMLDEVAAVPGTSGIMLTFDDFLVGMDAFGTRIQPLMKCRSEVRAAA
jgi:pyrimidine oxygenase